MKVYNRQGSFILYESKNHFVSNTTWNNNHWVIRNKRTNKMHSLNWTEEHIRALYPEKK